MLGSSEGHDLEALEATLGARSPGGRPRRARGGARRRARQEGPRLRADADARRACRRKQRKSFGQAVNGLKDARQRGAGSRKARRSSRAALDARLAAETRRRHAARARGPLPDGRIHPVSQVFDEVVEIFADMGFAVAEGPDIETDFHNFTALNIPPEHPARQEHDTFYLQPKGRRHAARCCARTPARCRSARC